LKIVIASKTTHCVLGSANQKVCATTGGDGESQTAALAEEQLVLVRRRHLPRHPLKRIQAAVTELVVLLVRIIWGLVGGTSENRIIPQDSCRTLKDCHTTVHI